MLSGAEALTPSERRVADLAAGGLTTRQIAETLFVTPKTVEFHLRHVYRKLDIASSREELARALAPAEAVAPSGGVTPAEAVAPSGGLTPAGAVAAAYPDNLAPLRKESPMTSNPFRPRSPGGAGELRDHRRRSRQ
jgi:DNA-binding CsgD family transcriptional regulator